MAKYVLSLLFAKCVLTSGVLVNSWLVRFLDTSRQVLLGIAGRGSSVIGALLSVAALWPGMK